MKVFISPSRSSSSWQRSHTVVVEVGEATAEVREEAEVVVVEVNLVRIVKAVVKIKVRVKPGLVRGRIRGRSTPGTGRPGIRTCPRSNRAPVTGFLGNLLIFVRNQAPAHGRMCGSQSLTNEIPASPKKLKKS